MKNCVCCKHIKFRRIWGHAPPEKFCILYSLRLLLVHFQLPENDLKPSLIHSQMPIGQNASKAIHYRKAPNFRGIKIS